jgi:hypothetical protein
MGPDGSREVAAAEPGRAHAVIAALVAHAVRFRRWWFALAVPAIVIAGVLVARPQAELPRQPFAKLPSVKVRSFTPARLSVSETSQGPGSAHVLAGRVIDEYDEPVADAEVLLRGRDAVRTDDEGRFEFHDVGRGGYVLLARTHDMTSGLEWAWPHERATLRLRRGATVVVHAVELDGRTPIANATMTLERQEGITGANGSVTFHNVDSVGVDAHAPGHGAVSRSLSEERAVDGAHYWMTLPRGAPIAGVVLDPTGCRFHTRASTSRPSRRQRGIATRRRSTPTPTAGGTSKGSHPGRTGSRRTQTT